MGTNVCVSVFCVWALAAKRFSRVVKQLGLGQICGLTLANKLHWPSTSHQTVAIYEQNKSKIINLPSWGWTGKVWHMLNSGLITVKSQQQWFKLRALNRNPHCVCRLVCIHEVNYCWLRLGCKFGKWACCDWNFSSGSCRETSVLISYKQIYEQVVILLSLFLLVRDSLQIFTPLGDFTVGVRYNRTWAHQLCECENLHNSLPWLVLTSI